jgi:O-antigen ligase
MLEQHPIFGAGLAGFPQRMALAVPRFKLTVIYPHDILLNFWSETGLLGLVSFAVITFVVARVAWKGWRAGPPEWRPIQLGVLLAMAAVLVHGLVDVPYFKNDLALEFWVLVALALAGARTKAAPSSAGRDGLVSQPVEFAGRRREVLEG